MSVKRFRASVPQRSWGKPDTDDQGRAICRQCRGLVPPNARLRCYCSHDCQQRFLIVIGAPIYKWTFDAGARAVASGRYVVVPLPDGSDVVVRATEAK